MNPMRSLTIGFLILLLLALSIAAQASPHVQYDNLDIPLSTNTPQKLVFDTTSIIKDSPDQFFSQPREIIDSDAQTIPLKNRLLYFNMAPINYSTYTNTTDLNIMYADFSGRVSCQEDCRGGEWEFRFSSLDLQWFRPIRAQFYFFSWNTGIKIYSKSVEIDPTSGIVPMQFPVDTLVIGELGFTGVLTYDVSSPGRRLDLPVYIASSLTLRWHADRSIEQKFQFYQYFAPSLADTGLVTVSTMAMNESHTFNHISFNLIGYQKSYYTLLVVALNITLIGPVEFAIVEDPKPDDIKEHSTGYIPKIDGKGYEKVKNLNKDHSDSDDDGMITCYLNSHEIKAKLNENGRELLLLMLRPEAESSTGSKNKYSELLDQTFFEGSFIQFDCHTLRVVSNDLLAIHNQPCYVKVEYSTAQNDAMIYTLPEKPVPFLLRFNPYRTSNAFRDIFLNHKRDQMSLPQSPAHDSVDDMYVRNLPLYPNAFISDKEQYYSPPSSKITPYQPQSFSISSNHPQFSQITTDYTQRLLSPTQQPPIDKKIKEIIHFPGNVPPSLIQASTFSTDGLITCSWSFQYYDIAQFNHFQHSLHIEYTGVVYRAADHMTSNIAVHTRPSKGIILPKYNTQHTQIIGYQTDAKNSSVTQTVPLYSTIAKYRRNVLTSTSTSFAFDFDLSTYPFEIINTTKPGDTEPSTQIMSSEIDIIAAIPYRGDIASQVQCGLIITKDQCAMPHPPDDEASRSAYKDCLYRYQKPIMTPELSREDVLSGRKKKKVFPTLNVNNSSLNELRKKSMDLYDLVTNDDTAGIISDNDEALESTIFEPTIQDQYNEINEGDPNPQPEPSYDPEDIPSFSFAVFQNQQRYNSTQIYLMPYKNTTLESFSVKMGWKAPDTHVPEDNFDTILFQDPLKYWEFVQKPRLHPDAVIDPRTDKEPMCRIWDESRHFYPGLDITLVITSHAIFLKGWQNIILDWPLNIDCPRVLFVKVPSRHQQCTPGLTCISPYLSQFSRPGSLLSLRGDEGAKNPSQFETLQMNSDNTVNFGMNTDTNIIIEHNIDDKDKPSVFSCANKMLNDFIENIYSSLYNNIIPFEYRPYFEEPQACIISSSQKQRKFRTTVNNIPKFQEVHYNSQHTPYILSAYDDIDNLVTYFNYEQNIFIENDNNVERMLQQQSHEYMSQISPIYKASIDDHDDNNSNDSDQILTKEKKNEPSFFEEYILKSNPNNRGLFSIRFASDTSPTPTRISADFFRLKPQNVIVPFITKAMFIYFIIICVLLMIVIALLVISHYDLIGKISTSCQRCEKRRQNHKGKTVAPLSAQDIDRKYTEEWPLHYYSELD